MTENEEENPGEQDDGPSTPTPLSERLRFGEFELNPISGELRDASGTIVPMPPQPIKVLSLLARRAGELVTREEIRNEVWGDETFVDFDKGLNFCILQIRNALGDDAKSPSYIETLPRRGYRLIAPVPSTPDPGSVPVETKQLRWAGIMIAIAFIVISVIALFVRRQPAASPPVEINERVMVAVLPFKNFGANQADLYFSDGVTEEITMHLGSIHPERLGVVARTSAFAYRETDRDIREIARELGVHYVLEGSVRRGDGETRRITAQLIDARDGSHLWAKTWDYRDEDPLATQTAIAMQVAATFRLEVLAERRPYQPVAAAHDAYLRGKQLLNDGGTAQIQASIEHFDRAIAEDPLFALPFVARVDALHLLQMRDRLTPKDARDQIAQAVSRSMKLAPDTSGALVARSILDFWYDWNFEDAMSDIETAIQINPSDAGARHDRGWLLIALGRFDEGIDEMRLAQRLDPVSPRANIDVAWAMIYAGRFDLAIEEARRVQGRFPEFYEVQHCFQTAWAGLGNEEASFEALHSWAVARDRLEDLAILDPSNPARSLQRYRAWRLQQILARTESLSDPLDLARGYASVGGTERALEALEKALEYGSPGLVLMRVDPSLAPIRHEDRFEAVAARVGI